MTNTPHGAGFAQPDDSQLFLTTGGQDLPWMKKDTQIDSVCLTYGHLNPLKELDYNESLELANSLFIASFLTLGSDYSEMRELANPLINIHFLTLRRNGGRLIITHWLVGNQPFGSMPRCCNSFRRIRFIQVASDESPSLRISSSSCERSSCANRIWYWSVLAFSLDIVITKLLSLNCCNYNVTQIVLQQQNTAKPGSVGALTGPLTTSDS